MPPKKGKKGKAKPMIIDGVDTATMTRDQLEQFALRLKAEMEREREERNFFQMERDKIRTFWEIAREKNQEITTELRKKDHEIDITEELADIESKKIMQQMKYLQYENADKISSVRAEALTRLKLAQEDHVVQEMELLKDKRELRRLLRESEDTHDQQIQQMKMDNVEEIHELRTFYESEAKDLELLHEEKMLALKLDIELIYRMQMFEVEERKNTQIQKLIENHDLAFNDMKNYYNDITLNNLSLISSLKDEMESLRHQTERSDRLAAEMMMENRKLKEPLEIAQQEVQLLKRKLEFYERDRAQLKRLQARNAFVEKQLKSLTWETDTLLLRNEALVKEREELKEKFEDVVIELQQKTNLKNVLLERKIEVLERTRQSQRLTLQDTTDRCREMIDSRATQTDTIYIVSHKTDVLEKKTKLIEELKYELARVTKAHDDLLDTYEAKLEQYGIPKEELGFEPLRFTSKWEYLCGPAGLVAKNN